MTFSLFQSYNSQLIIELILQSKELVGVGFEQKNVVCWLCFALRFFLGERLNMARNDGAILSQIKKLEVALHNTVEPQFNEGPRDWQNAYIIRRFHYNLSRFFFMYSWFNKGFFGHWTSGHTEQCNYLPEWPKNNSFRVPNSHCLKQPLLNQPYFTITGVKKIVSYTEHFII